MTFDLAPILTCAALFAGTFVQEGVALTAGALLIIRHDVQAVWVALTLFAGVVAGDCGVYGLGALARRSEWARRLVAGVDLEKGKKWLDARMLPAVATSHLVPFVLFPTFVAFGWFAVPFRRFAMTSALFNAIYIPIALVILTTAGAAAWPYLSAHAWLLWVAAGVVVIALIAARWRRAPA